MYVAIAMYMSMCLFQCLAVRLRHLYKYIGQGAECYPRVHEKCDSAAKQRTLAEECGRHLYAYACIYLIGLKEYVYTYLRMCVCVYAGVDHQTILAAIAIT